MRRVRLLLAASLSLWISGAIAFSISSSPDPFTISIGNGEKFGNTFYNAAGRTPLPKPTSLSTTAVIITAWQSLNASSALGTYTVTNTTRVFNFNIYDGGLYQCQNPVLGATYDSAVASANSPNCALGDALVTAGTYTDVIMVTTAVGGTTCADWVGGALTNRIPVTMNRLAARGLTAATGFTGQTWILPHGGETDNTLNTQRAPLATCIRNWAAAYAAAGTGTSRFFVPTESMLSGVTNANVTGAQADAVASGCTTCRQGANYDAGIPAGNRQGDGTHLTQASSLTAASLDQTVITNCKNTAC